MKKIIIALSLCVASSASFAAAASACAAGVPLSGGVTDTTGGGTAGSAFVKTPFNPKCSANTTVGFAQGASSAAVGAISSKGNQIFGGHTNGGAVAKTADCASTGCVAGDATGAADTALAASST